MNQFFGQLSPLLQKAVPPFVQRAICVGEPFAPAGTIDRRALI